MLHIFGTKKKKKKVKELQQLYLTGNIEDLETLIYFLVYVRADLLRAKGRSDLTHMHYSDWAGKSWNNERQQDLIWQTHFLKEYGYRKLSIQEKSFFDAVEKDDRKKIKKYLKSGINVNAVTEDNLTALHFAIGHGNIELMQFLVSKGADVDFSYANGFYPLEYAVVCRQKKALMYLLEQTCSLETSALHYAAALGEIELLELLMQAGVEVNRRDQIGRTALHEAANCNCLNVMCLLIQSGAELDCMDYQGWTPLCLAVMRNHFVITEYLLRQGADPKVGAEDLFKMARALGNTAVFALLSDKKEKVVQKTLVNEYENSKKLKGYFTAVHRGQIRKVAEYLELGLDVNSVNRDHLTAFHIAVSYGDIWMIDLLLKNGADRNFTPNHGLSPLEYARHCKQKDMVKFLEKIGCK